MTSLRGWVIALSIGWCMRLSGLVGWFKGLSLQAMYPLCVAQCTLHIIFWLIVFAYIKCSLMYGKCSNLASFFHWLVGWVYFLNYCRSLCIFTAYSYGNFLSGWRATNAGISSLTCEMCPFSMTVFVADVWLAVSSPQQVFIVTWSHVQDLIKFPSHL